MLPKPLLGWKSVPFLERPYTTIALISFLILLSVVLYQVTIIQWQSPLFYIGGMLLVMLNLLPYFIITEYTLY
ncbi:MAG TPA: hypothetical protein P5533_09670, partial [Candidatus Cloacimonadota bacterium]|nr:hypothetical protein [Candidatus Cloacimonadota bacterium]